MPELPEVENARRCLLRAGLPERTFKGADIGWAKTVKRPDLEGFVLGLRDATVQDCAQEGQVHPGPLQVEDGTTTLIIHLG